MWPKYWSFSFSIIPSKEHPGLISFKMDWLYLLAVQVALNSLSLGDKAKNLGKTMVGANTIFSDGPTAAVAAGKAINDYYDKGGTEAFIDRLTAPKMDVSNSVSRADFDAISNNITICRII